MASASFFLAKNEASAFVITASAAFLSA